MIRRFGYLTYSAGTGFVSAVFQPIGLVNRSSQSGSGTFEFMAACWGHEYENGQFEMPDVRVLR
jgi:hypothetical protein